MPEPQGSLQILQSTSLFTEGEIRDPERWRDLSKVIQPVWERAWTQHCMCCCGWKGHFTVTVEKLIWPTWEMQVTTERELFCPHIPGSESSPNLLAGSSIVRLHSSCFVALSTSLTYHNSCISQRVFSMVVSSRYTRIIIPLALHKVWINNKSQDWFRMFSFIFIILLCLRHHSRKCIYITMEVLSNIFY
jgi:hypothetical protein